MIEGEPCRLSTAGGATVRARDVVVATHYPVLDRALLFTRLVPHRELMVAAPIPADQDPGGMYITPEHDTRSVRTGPYDGGRRLLIVTGESFTPGSPGVAGRYERLADWTRRHFGAEPTYRRAAQDNDTTDRIPCTGLLHWGARHCYVTTGYGGWGMTNGVMSGRLLAARVSCTRCPRPAPTWAASSPSTTPNAPGSAPATGPASPSTARSFGARPTARSNPGDLRVRLRHY